MAPKASELLTAEQVQELRGKSDLVGALLVLHAWALIFGSFAVFAGFPNPLTFVLAVMVIGARQLGLATIVSSAMIRHEIAQGRAPVWGADEGNVASLRLAARLGFQAVDEIWVAACAR